MNTVAAWVWHYNRRQDGVGRLTFHEQRVQGGPGLQAATELGRLPLQLLWDTHSSRKNVLS